MPISAFALFSQFITEIKSGASGGKLSFGLVISLWTASSGIAALMQALNVAFDVPASRSWWHQRLVAIALTFAIGLTLTASLVFVRYQFGRNLHYGQVARVGRLRPPLDICSSAGGLGSFVSLFNDHLRPGAQSKAKAVGRCSSWHLPGLGVLVFGFKGLTILSCNLRFSYSFLRISRRRYCASFLAPCIGGGNPPGRRTECDYLACYCWFDEREHRVVSKRFRHTS